MDVEVVSDPEDPGNWHFRRIEVPRRANPFDELREQMRRPHGGII